VLRTFSKSFSLCGMRVGLAFAHPSVSAEIGKVKDSYNMNRLSQAAAIAALDDYAWMEENDQRDSNSHIDHDICFRHPTKGTTHRALKCRRTTDGSRGRVR
jgi:aspartate/methionine/tyrosine aminotransferase